MVKLNSQGIIFFNYKRFLQYITYISQNKRALGVMLLLGKFSLQQSAQFSFTRLIQLPSVGRMKLYTEFVWCWLTKPLDAYYSLLRSLTIKQIRVICLSIGTVLIH